jgi:hypothetical protein
VAGVHDATVGYEDGDVGIGRTLVCARETGCDVVPCIGGAGDWGTRWFSVERFNIVTATYYCGRSSFLHVATSRGCPHFGKTFRLVLCGCSVPIAVRLVLADKLVWLMFQVFHATSSRYK